MFLILSPSKDGCRAARALILRQAQDEVSSLNSDRLLDTEFDSLGEWQGVGIVDGRGLPAHIGLPGVRAAFTSAASLLLATEGAADFGAGGTDVHIGDAAIRP